MPNLNEHQNLKLADGLANKAFQTKRPLIDVVEKTAREMALNPDQIRTLSRMSNVAMFHVQFKVKEGTDRQVDFGVVDAEQVIQRISSNPNPPQSATVTNDKMAPVVKTASTSDYDVTPRTSYQPESVKTASVATAAPTIDVPRWKQVEKAQKVCNDYATAKSAAHLRWQSRLETLTKRCREQLDDRRKVAFVEGMVHFYGDVSMPEIREIVTSLKLARIDLSPEKTAQIREFAAHAPNAVYDLLKEATAARDSYVRYDLAIAKLKDMYPEVR